ncbi:MAG TPA: GNAT family N-acetyltransferase [Candidatus Limnocylindrales bacterium]|nr:GNAT family N-acetyltransferase [Candidatus Limnocylindrales bacterium]
MPEVRAAGLEALTLTTRLLQRVRLADPEAGQWEAADLQWWWRLPRRSDTLEQCFWLDDEGPVAAVILTDWSGTWSCDPIVLPRPAGSSAAGDDVRLADVWRRAQELMAELPPEPIEVLARDDDVALAALLAASGSANTGAGDRTYWLAAADRAPVAAVAEGFRLVDRVADAARPHPLRVRNGEGVADRLAQCSLYDPRLDLAMLAPDGAVAGYALFWADRRTGVGLVEPVRVEEAHLRRGLGLALVTEGLERLAGRGIGRIKVSCRSEAACGLYERAGFRLAGTSTTWRREPRG